jgi:hypothetical protein
MGGPDELERTERRAKAIDRLRLQLDHAQGANPDVEAALCIRLLHPARSPDEISEGLERSRRLLDDRRGEPGMRAQALNARAYMLAFGGSRSRMPEAEQAVREALCRCPSSVGMHETLALVLVRLGRFDEAEPIITRVVEEVPEWRAEHGTAPAETAKALAASRCTLALLYAGTERIGAARREVAEARSLDATFPLLKELDRILGSHPDRAGQRRFPVDPSESQRWGPTGQYRS